MARKRATSNSNGIVPVRRPDGVQSQSAITAQIVDDAVHHTSQLQADGAVTFRHLLDEICANPTAIEKDVQSNYKLVAVVAEAGLDVLSKEDPFAVTAELIAQSIASLHVIELAIQRTPEVLLYVGPGTDGPGSQMCLWLLPKLLQAFVSQNHTSLHDAIQRLLYTFLHCMFRASDRWEEAVVLLRFYQSCVDDLMTGLATVSSLTKIQMPFQINVPSQETRALICQDGRQSVASRRVTIVTVPSLHSCYHIVLSLLLTVTAKAAFEMPPKPRRLDGVPNLDLWASQIFVRVWHTLVTWMESSNSSVSKSGIFETVLHELFKFSDCLIMMKPRAVLLHGAIQFLLKCVEYILQRSVILDDNNEIQHLLALNISIVPKVFGQLPGIRREVQEILIPTLLVLTNHEFNRTELTLELQMAMKTILRHLNNDTDHDSNGVDLLPELEDYETKPSKRQRRGPSPLVDNHVDRTSRMKAELCFLLGSADHQNLQRLHRSAIQTFTDLSEEDKGKIITLLKEIPCAGTPLVGVWTSAEREFKSKQAVNMCGGNCTTSSSTWSDEDWICFDRILTNLTKAPTLQASKEGRVQLMIAAKRLFFHVSRPSLLDLSTSVLGKWCLQSLRSSLRELRIVAGQTLPMFLRADAKCPEETLKNNRVIALDFLKSLSDLSESRCTETAILALGQIARVCGDEEVNIILLRLIDFLGDSNPLICSVAYVELVAIAQFTSTSTDELLKPFWRTIGPHVVKDLQTNPQKAQQLSDLLGIGVSQLLVQTQSDTVPYLVMLKKNDVLQRIAAACSSEASVWNICKQPQTLSLILSLVLIQHPTNAEEHLYELLRHVNPKFRSEDVQPLLKLNSISVACELLKASGDGDNTNQKKVIQSLHNFTDIVAERQSRPSRGSSTQSLVTADFLENHALGIMASFSDGIDNLRRTSSAPERRRCLRGLEVMIYLAGDAVNFALPQIRACLQSALEDPEIRQPAFSAWTTLLRTLESEENLDGLIDHYFSAIVQNWQELTSLMQQSAHDTVAELLKKHNALIRNKVMTIPSLASIPLLSKFESELERLKCQFNLTHRFHGFARRCQDESATVCLQALRELLPLLESSQGLFHSSAVSEQPDSVVADLTRSLLDTCVKFGEQSREISDLCAQSLGIIGCLDPNRIETVRDEPQIMILSNFDQAEEAIEFITFMLQNILVKAFHSVSNPRSQSFLAYVMQELLKFCGFTKETAYPYRLQGSQPDEIYQRWIKMSERVRTTLTPLLTSRYVLTTQNQKGSVAQIYPIFSSSPNHTSWLRNFVSDLLCKAKGDNAQMIFTVLGRIVRSNDLSVANFSLPFAVTNIIISGTERETQAITQEFLTVLQASTSNLSHPEIESLKLCSQNVFQCLDYLSRWLQMKKKEMSTTVLMAAKSSIGLSEFDEETILAQIRSVERIISSIPAEVIARRAVECKSYARALFHWEQYIRQTKQRSVQTGAACDLGPLYQRLQDIYSQIDEPDGIEGIASQLHVLDPAQQVLEHENASRWSAAQSWYELRLKQHPDNESLQSSLLTCLKNSGQYDMVVNQAKVFAAEGSKSHRALPIIVESAWFANRWNDLEDFLSKNSSSAPATFNTSLGAAMIALKNKNPQQAVEIIAESRASIARTLSTSTTASLQSCHEQLLKLHALYELELLSDIRPSRRLDSEHYGDILNHRLEVLGAFLPEKQYLLGIRRGAMRFSNLGFEKSDFASSWMTTAKLARKGNTSHIAYNAVLQASNLGDESAKIEHARLLWKEGQHRKAIQSLEGAIAVNAFKSNTVIIPDASGTYPPADKDFSQNFLSARAHLLLAKWLDAAGQTQSHIINNKYQVATHSFARWEKGQYYLGRYYNKLLESEKVLPASKQGHAFLCGETAKLVVEIYLRSLSFGSKYLFQTLPKLLTLWLDLGETIETPISNDVQDDLRKRATDNRLKMLATMNRQVSKYLEKIPPYIFYTALAQMITRITHPHPKVWAVLESILVKVVSAFPQQSLWSLLAVVKSTAKERAGRGLNLLNKLKDKGKSIRYEGISVELRTLINQGQRLSDQLLYACEANIEGRSTTVSLTKTLGVNPKVAPCPLAIPLEKTLSASLPAFTSVPNTAPNPKAHRAFPLPRDTITISSIADDVLVLSSLQRPRKITIRGSDGGKYGLLCKPKDDLRKDQRLMEFNAMINRSLKNDAEASKRRLYIKTYAVTPLNEECGLIEWVDGLKPLRDILLTLYRQKGIKTDFITIRDLLAEACAAPENHTIFTNKILPLYPPILHEYFAELFPDPSTWFTARLRYTRSCAVASMVGYVLGLGDRHGENVLLEQSSGGIFHVDFNCLFEKGLTFEKPELVPFRLTHNMVDACGVYGVEGPWRKCAELAFRCMRSTEDALLTILETFVYDPTADFVGPGGKNKKKKVPGVPETPREVLESVKGKFGGLLRGESVPLSLEGVVDALIRQSTDPQNLSAMYIGWCAFL